MSRVIILIYSIIICMSYIDSKYTVQKITFTRSKSSVFDNSLIWFVNWYRRTESSNSRKTHLLAHAISILNTPVIHTNFVPEKRSDVQPTKKELISLLQLFCSTFTQNHTYHVLFRNTSRYPLLLFVPPFNLYLSVLQQWTINKK